MLKQQIYREGGLTAVTRRLILLILTSCYCVSVFSQESIRSVIAKSNFIFYGTIIKMNASNINLPPTSNTAVVKVEKVIDAVEPYQLMEGKDITVLLASASDKKENVRQVFYTTGWYYGKTLGVKEVPNVQARNLQDSLKQKIATERINIHNDSIRVELNKSSLVIIGTVVEVGIKEKQNLAFESEHNPEYSKALIQIQTILKGKTNSKQVTVFYSSSDDVSWSNSPKLSRGQEGIFLLQSQQAPPTFPVRGFTLLDKRDVQSMNNLSIIRNLLKKQ